MICLFSGCQGTTAAVTGEEFALLINGEIIFIQFLLKSRRN